MKLKSLEKKIRRLEGRLRDGPKKLAKLKRKLAAIMTVSARETKRKPAGAKGRSAAKKVKRKLNLSPERRAQLAAAMRARWAAKRAAAAANPQNASTDRDFKVEQSPQVPESGHDGA